MRDLLIENLIEKKTDLKERLELISKYSNNSLVRSLSVPEKLFLYEITSSSMRRGIGIFHARLTTREHSRTGNHE